MKRSGFTLLELVLVVGILAVISTVAYFTFNAGVNAWRTGTRLADSLHHAEYVLEQVVMGLRSAYYPDGGKANANYGFVLEDDGSDGPDARDTISWVKLGTSLVGADAPFAGIPHRVEIGVFDPDDASASHGFGVRAWRIDSQPEDFDPEEEVEPFFLTDKILGINCRTLANDQEDEDELAWEDEWEDTNRVPFAVEITLYLEPPREGDDPVEVQRIAEIPLAGLSWKDRGVVSPLARPRSTHTSISTGGGSGQTPGSDSSDPKPRPGPRRRTTPPAGSGASRPSGNAGGSP
ncbi:MAG: PulJ/GspJ family protein [Kiritimatiellia bacterium]|jgi:prepilin-type N-terminal cleavage/methylation domain-containing protein